MDAEIDIWRLAAGLGLFLFGMHQLEESLKLLAGRSFKKFLREHTEHPVKGVLAGAVSTAALQSSSVVSLIVLAFVGTGVVSLASAIAIVFGSNLGTTATGWIVATVGFKLDIEALALPLVAIGGLGVVWTSRRNQACWLQSSYCRPRPDAHGPRVHEERCDQCNCIIQSGKTGCLSADYLSAHWSYDHRGHSVQFRHHHDYP